LSNSSLGEKTLSCGGNMYFADGQTDKNPVPYLCLDAESIPGAKNKTGYRDKFAFQ
jgi:hypothetical protein